ncbi:hypothetical protein ACFX2B_012845 [Malus domestica]
MISMIGMGKSSFGQALLRSQKSMQTFSCSNFLRTMTMLEIHIGYCTSRMKPASISLSISASIYGMSSGLTLLYQSRSRLDYKTMHDNGRVKVGHFQLVVLLDLVHT